MKLNKIIIATILILGIVSIINKADRSYITVTFNGAIIAVPYSTDQDLLGKTINPGRISDIILKKVRASTRKSLENHLVNCKLQPVAHQLLSRATLKILLALPWMTNKADKSPKLCQRKKLHVFRLMINFTF
ncbi:hypothetical protein EAE91_01220 [Photorhabdus noenieputensis]|uniref:hypothetical protein n=1 Tax=Photorhabdus noenieputensis TaxID=1208607 RepID=UPI001BD1C58A|nr:hypothetical protein [Photorhabdus noenieputensis]MBS9435851.1 hypothetical protein [Photorhabdus noenieputensis]MCK3667588.1 hypothetical protein [Photorhabdus noenieputensis]